MKAADGTPIVERRAEDYAACGEKACMICRLIEELSAAEERERVLRNALKTVSVTLCECRYSRPKKGCNCDIHAARAIIDAAVATPAPEPSEQNGGSK